MCKRYQEVAGERLARFTKTSNSWTGRENIYFLKAKGGQLLGVWDRDPEHASNFVKRDSHRLGFIRETTRVFPSLAVCI